MAENFRENGKSNRRKDFIRASAGEIRNDSDGSVCFLPEAGLELTMVSKEGKNADFNAFPLNAYLPMEKGASRES